MVGGETIDFAVALKNEREFRLAQPRRRLDERIEHHLQVEGRAADDLEHVGGGGLLLERLGELARALLLRLEQADI